MGFLLSDLLEYDNIVIQCHDNPDADALASGYALHTYLNDKGKRARFVYSGRFEVKKSNLRLMTSTLKIPVEYLSEADIAAMEEPDILVTVDCQYGESNVTKLPANKVAVIDHHQVAGELPEMSDVRSGYGSCSTVMWKLLEKEGFSINKDELLATALYYGLLTDTNDFTEIYHPADRDLRDSAHFRNSLITQYRNSNLSMEELLIAGEALKHTSSYDKYHYAIVEAKPCDPNILGIISDMVLEVDSINTVLVYSLLDFGVKMSVRSCITEVQASELAAYIAEGLGGGGGHLVKAGGFLKRDLIEKAGVEYTCEAVEEMLQRKMNDYFEFTELIYASKYTDGNKDMDKYVKLPVCVGYVPSIAMGESGKHIIVRTLEGDVDIAISEDVYIIIGIEGEVYPIKKEKFEKSYKKLGNPYVFEGEYPPTVINSVTGDRIDLLPHAMCCMASGGGEVYAKKLDKRVKVFTSWDKDRYYLGKPGDYLAVRTDDLKDVYVIAKDIFGLTYKRV